MRPLYLEMTAFGSYAGTTALPFEKLTHGLYLVTGNTGAGKTTIFDAIMFALYGSASGSDRSPDLPRKILYGIRLYAHGTCRCPSPRTRW